MEAWNVGCCNVLFSPYTLITREAFEEQKNQNIGKRSAAPRFLLLAPEI